MDNQFTISIRRSSGANRKGKRGSSSSSPQNAYRNVISDGRLRAQMSVNEAGTEPMYIPVREACYLEHRELLYTHQSLWRGGSGEGVRRESAFSSVWLLASSWLPELRWRAGGNPVDHQWIAYKRTRTMDYKWITHTVLANRFTSNRSAPVVDCGRADRKNTLFNLFAESCFELQRSKGHLHKRFRIFGSSEACGYIIAKNSCGRQPNSQRELR